MPAYEIMCSLARQGVSAAVAMNYMGEVSITAIQSGRLYHSEESCLKVEVPLQEAA